MAKDEKNETYVIPQNYEDNLVTASGINMRNIIEGVILFVIIGGLIWLIPMESIKIKAILIILFGGAVGVFGIVGIHHCSLSEYLSLVIRYKSSNTVLSRSVIFESQSDEDEFDKTLEVNSEDNNSKKSKKKSKGVKNREKPRKGKEK